MSRITLEQVSKRFGDVTAVDDVSLSVEEGQFFALLGPSGSGKTTVLRLIAGFLRPTAGTILIGGQDVSTLPPERRGIGLVFQNYALFPHLTVFDNIAFGLRARKVTGPEISRRVGVVLEKTNLAGYEGRYPRELSGGEAQRVALARSLVIEPRVLLLDEPLGALDRLLRERMQYWIKALQNDLQVTTIYVTHDQEEALTMSDRVAVMHRGVVQQVDSPEALYRSPATRFVAAFMGDNNILAGTVVDAAAGLVTVEIAGGHRVRARGGDGSGIGQAVDLSVRPEDIAMRPQDGTAGPNAFAGTVAERIYRGAVNRYEVTLEGGGPAVNVSTPGRVDQFEPSAAVTVTWAEEACTVLPAGAGDAVQAAQGASTPVPSTGA